jgi:Uma2 family endonuclease
MVTEVVEDQNQAVGFIPKTYEEFLAWSDEMVLADWVKGKVSYHDFPRTYQHQNLLGFLSVLIQVFAEENNLGEIATLKYLMYLPEIPSARQPDIMFVHKSGRERFTTYYLNGAADLVIEVISPESRSRDRGVKFYEYESAAVKEYWLIDYERGQARFYELNSEGIYQLALIENGIYRSKVLEGLFIETDWLWQETLPTLMEVLKEWKLV